MFPDAYAVTEHPVHRREKLPLPAQHVLGRHAAIHVDRLALARVLIHQRQHPQRPGVIRLNAVR